MACLPRMRQSSHHTRRFSQEQRPVHRTPYPQPRKEAPATLTPDRGKGTGHLPDEHKNRSGHDANDFVAEYWQNLRVQTHTSGPPPT